LCLAGPDAVDFTTIINQFAFALEFVKINKVQASVVELTIVIGSEQGVGWGVSSLDTSVEEDVVDIGDRAWVKVENITLKRPASVLLDWSTLVEDHELEFKFWLRVDELEFDISEVVVGHGDVSGEDLDAVHLGLEGVVVPVTSTLESESEGHSRVLRKRGVSSSENIRTSDVEVSKDVSSTL